MVEQAASFEQVLRDRGLRITAGRRAILRELVRQESHVDAEGLLASLNRRGNRVSRATVYRTLSQLVDSGLLRKHELGDRQTLYEPAIGRKHHEHMICISCGRIIEFIQDQIERLQTEVCREHGFRPVSHTLQIHGICRHCDGKSL